MRPDNDRPSEVAEFHAAWRSNDVPALIDLILRTPTGWTIIAFALTLLALMLALADAWTSRPPRDQAAVRPAAPDIDRRDLQRPGCRNCPAQPATPMQTWVTTDDYPPSAIRSGEEGVSSLSLTVGSDGRVTACALIEQSGSLALDAAACEALTARARYFPATDASGAAIESSVTRRVRWQLPPG